MATVTIITDGSADNNTRQGGYCAIIRNSSSLTELTGFADNTTSNRMEMMAAIEGLRAVTTPSKITLVSDSTYLLKTLKQKWYETWFAEEAKSNRTKPRPNLDLWKQIVGLIQFHDVRFVKIKGHSGDYWNERCDKLADYARRNRVGTRTAVAHFVEGLRCEHRSRNGKQCVFHDGHTGDHVWRKKVEAKLMQYG